MPGWVSGQEALKGPHSLAASETRPVTQGKLSRRKRAGLGRCHAG